ncbi:MAG: cob(I)yrinic acid a,c-diamide adenosyltransferase [Chloroflexi bacterium]|nr:cob(I)yrinic acid a,c-diamide adenosyltransferase [Chloroflexota bacterium]
MDSQQQKVPKEERLRRADEQRTLRGPEDFTEGLVEVFTGNGKGKSSAAFGVVLRATGHGLRSHVVLFMKGDVRYGEFTASQYLPGVSMARFGPEHLIDPRQISDEDKAEVLRGLEHAESAMLSGDYDLIVMDEINVAVAWKLIEVERLVELIKKRPPQVELILTGRSAHQQVIDLADLVTEMREIKHPYTKGILSRAGIDY